MLFRRVAGSYQIRGELIARGETAWRLSAPPLGLYVSEGQVWVLTGDEKQFLLDADDAFFTPTYTRPLRDFMDC